jgi:LSD1 subclass zinc finger protein
LRLLINCPFCRNDLQIPDGTTAMVRCPACKNVFSALVAPLPPEPEVEREREKPEVKQKTITCPTCQSSLQVPESTTAMIRCPVCKNVFSTSAAPLPPEPEPEEGRGQEHEEPEIEQKTITCPSCQSGLQVPKSTTAMIRCPVCKTVFSAEDGLSTFESEAEVEPEKKKRTRRTTPTRKTREDEDDKRPKKIASAKKADDESPPTNRDFDPDIPKKKTKKRRNFDEEEMSAAERKALKAAFNRAAWGAKLIWMSILLFMLSMLMIIAFFYQIVFKLDNPAFGYCAGMLGILNWVLGAIGVGLCLSGPPSKGHWGYGISAAVATGIHLLLLLVAIATSKEHVDSLKGVSESERSAFRWGFIATRMDMITYYPTHLIYRDEMNLAPGSVAYAGIAVLCGVAEMVRIILIMMLLSCLAQAAGDEELSRACTRAGGMASFSPGVLAFVFLGYTAFVFETRAEGVFFSIILWNILRGLYVLLAGCMLRALTACREVVDVLEEPFQSQQPVL